MKGQTLNYANHISYSDINPYEVIRVVNDKTLEVREMNATRDERVKLQWMVGGFAGHCVNQLDQAWIITSDESRPIIRIRLTKRGWQNAHGMRFTLNDKPIKFYDYNF